MSTTDTAFDFLSDLGLAIDVELSRPAPAADPIADLLRAAKAARKHLRRLEREADAARDALMESEKELSSAQDRELMRLEDRCGRIEELLGVLDDVRREFRKSI